MVRHNFFWCGKTGLVKRFCPMLSSIGSVGRSSSQPKTFVQEFGRSVVRPLITPIFEVESSSGAQRS